MDDFLRLHWAGEQRCESLYKVGPYERDCYILHFILSGRGTIETREGAWEASAGQMFAIYQGEIISYRADKNEPWHYVWADFTGAAAPGLLEQTGFTKKNRVSPPLEREKTAALFADMRGKFGSPAAELEGSAALIRLFAEIVREFPSDKLFEKDGVAENAARLMRASFCDESCRIERIAAMLGVSRSQLFRLFKEKFNASPKERLCILRIEQAKKLLAEGGMTVAEVGYACGYADPLYFSRQFKEKTGVSPTTFRKTTR